MIFRVLQQVALIEEEKFSVRKNMRKKGNRKVMGLKNVNMDIDLS